MINDKQKKPNSQQTSAHAIRNHGARTLLKAGDFSAVLASALRELEFDEKEEEGSKEGQPDYLICSPRWPRIKGGERG